MKTERAFVVPWWSKKYHAVRETFIGIIECGIRGYDPQIRIEGKGAEAWLKRNGYTLCRNCARAMEAREKREAEDARGD